MIYKDFQDEKLSLLGFGMMRLPQREDNTIDEEQTQKMVDYAIENGVNYFDTAYPYHEGKSEIITSKCLKKYPRNLYNLADKFPGHQVLDSYDPSLIFEEQLKKCNVDYFDFYLLHNVAELSIDTYLNPKWKIIEYFVRQKELGRIRHLGFSCHAQLDTLKKFLDIAGQHMEFCQIQCNYLDWTLQDAKAKVTLLNQYHIPIWVMEPVRGGKLATIPKETEIRFKSYRDESPAAWAFRFLQDVEGIHMILSGMSNMDQMKDNIQTFQELKPLTDEEKQAIMSYAESIKDSVPCTACRYCCDGCPQELDIPKLIATYNDAKVGFNFTPGMYIDSLPDNKKPSACLMCGQCMHACPQGIDIPKVLKDLTELMDHMPHWKDVCRERADAAKANHGK